MEENTAETQKGKRRIIRVNAEHFLKAKDLKIEEVLSNLVAFAKKQSQSPEPSQPQIPQSIQSPTGDAHPTTKIKQKKEKKIRNPKPKAPQAVYFLDGLDRVHDSLDTASCDLVLLPYESRVIGLPVIGKAQRKGVCWLFVEDAEYAKFASGGAWCLQFFIHEQAEGTDGYKFMCAMDRIYKKCYVLDYHTAEFEDLE